jgi:hypothetical protein
MTRLGVWLTAGALILAGWGLWLRERDRASEERGILQERVRTLDSSLAVLRTREVQIEQRVERDTVYVNRWVKTERLLRDTLFQWMRDTVAIHDTAIVVRYVRVTDSTIQACTIALESCLRLAENRQQQIHRLELKVASVQPKAESKLSQFLHKSLLVSAGVGVGFLLSERQK